MLAKSVPAVLKARVNELYPSRRRRIIRLDGRWDFETDPEQSGFKDRRFFDENHRWRQTLRVPGCWEAQGVGGAGHTIGCYRSAQVSARGTYRGLAWYGRALRAPTWAPGERWWLKIGNPGNEVHIYVNGHPLGHLMRPVGTYRFDITPWLVAQEPNRICLAVNNALPYAGGADLICVLGGLVRPVELERTPPVWIEDIAIQPALSRQEVRGRVTLVTDANADFTRDYVLAVDVHCLGRTGLVCGRALVRIRPDRERTVDIRVSVTNVRPWSPEAPHLYKLTARLLMGRQVMDEWSDRFGFRELEVRGQRLYLNGAPCYINGCGGMTRNPWTLATPPNRAWLKQVLRRIKAYGFNFIRYHTEVPIPEMFDAADEAGLMLQPENPSYNGKNNEPVQADGVLDLSHADQGKYAGEAAGRIRMSRELFEHYRNHPSFTNYCMGNEYYDAKADIRRLWYRAVKRMDPTRLALSSDGVLRHRRTMDDYAAGFGSRAAELGRAPVVLHEFLNLPTAPDIRQIGQYRGALLTPDTLRTFARWARQNGLSRAQLVKLAQASHHYQTLHLKCGLEQARATPGIEGYGYWRFDDFLNYPMTVGIVNMFGQAKDREPAQIKTFNQATILFSNIESTAQFIGFPAGEHLEIFGRRTCAQVMTAGARATVRIYVSHYDSFDLRRGVLEWQLVDGRRVIANGRIPVGGCARGAIRELCALTFKLPEHILARAYELRVTLRAGERLLVNQWPFWAFPATEVTLPKGTLVLGHVPDSFFAPAGPADGLSASFSVPRLVLTDSLRHPGVLDYLDNGGRVLLVSPRDFACQGLTSHPGWWMTSPNRTSGMALETHPSLRHLPHQGFASWPVARLLNNLFDYEYPLRLQAGHRLMAVSPVFRRLPFQADAIAYGIWSSYRQNAAGSWNCHYGWVPHIFEARVGQGRLHACMLNMRLHELIGRYWSQHLLRYLVSSRFQPARRVTRQALARAIRPGNVAVHCPGYYRSSRYSPFHRLASTRRRRYFYAWQDLSFNPQAVTGKDGVIRLTHDLSSHYPKIIYVDLLVRRAVDAVVVHNTQFGNTKSIRVSLTMNDATWRVIGESQFPQRKYAPLRFSGAGYEARFLRIEFLDSYRDAVDYEHDCILLRGIEVFEINETTG